MVFRLVPKSMTLNDFERRYGNRMQTTQRLVHIHKHDTAAVLVRSLLPQILGQTDRIGAKLPIFDLFSPVAPRLNI